MSSHAWWLDWNCFVVTIMPTILQATLLLLLFSAQFLPAVFLAPVDQALKAFSAQVDLKLLFSVLTWPVHACSKLADTGKKKSKRKKKSCRTSLSGDTTPHSTTAGSALDDIDTDLPVTPKSGLDSDLSDADLALDHPADHLGEQAHQTEADNDVSGQVRAEPSEEESSKPTKAPSSTGAATAHHSRTSSATADLDIDSQSSAADLAIDSAGQEAVRAALEAAVTQANSAIEVGVAAGDDVLQRVLDELDFAIQNAVDGSVSAKYSKKVRKRLQQLLHEAVSAAASGDEEAAVSAAAANAVAQKQEWQTAGAKPHRISPSKADSLVANSSHTGKHHVPTGALLPQQRLHHRQGQGHLQGQSGAVLAHLLQASGVVAPPPPPPPRQPLQPPPNQAASQVQQPGGSALQSPAGAGHVRTKSGNAWGVPAKQRRGTQVSNLYMGTLASVVCSVLILVYLTCELPVSEQAVLTCIPSAAALLTGLA